MRKVSLRSLWGHKRRLVSTVISVVLGVAFISGTNMLSNTIDSAFDALFATGSNSIDVVVQGEPTVSDNFAGDQRAALDPSVLALVQGVDGVAAAQPFSQLVTYSTQLLGTDGDAVGAVQGPPTLVESWVDDEILSPYELTEGSRPPAAPNEIAVNVLAAEDGGYAVGDTVTVATQAGIQQYLLVGTVTFGGATSSGGAISLEFTLDQATTLAGSGGKLSNVFARAADGISDTDLVTRVTGVLPAGTEALTGTQWGEQTADSVSSGFQFFTSILKVFALLALLVGIFIIYNTFQILLAQRTRELALLRAVGASRRQVLTSVLLEAVVVAAVAAVLGLLVGYLLASVAFSAFGGGGELPVDGISVLPGTLLNGFIVGFIVTLIAAVFPAIRATRVPPLAAMREVALERTTAGRVRLGIGTLGLLLAAALLGTAWRDDPELGLVGLGAGLLIVSSIIVGPVLATPTIHLFGSWVPRLKGVTGRMAFENATRNPKRTAATAAALVITVAVVGFTNIVAASATDSVQGRVSRGFSADVYILGGGGFGPPQGFSPELSERIGALDGVEFVSVQKVTFAVQITYPDGDQSTTDLGTADPTTFPQVADPHMAEGALTDLTDAGMLIDRRTAESHDVAIGDQLQLTFADGHTTSLAVQGISDDRVALFTVTVTNPTFTANVAEDLDAIDFVKATEGTDVDALVERIDALADEYPNVQVEDEEGFVGSVAKQITGIITLIQALLGVAIVISFIGIANTLSLSIHERTREIGLLRAVGTTRNQMRATMRWEAAIIAVLGTVVGLGISLVVSRAVIEGLSGFGLDQFTIPLGSLVVIVVLAAAISILASILPARRAAKLDILHAIAHD